MTPKRLELKLPLPDEYAAATRADYEDDPARFPAWRAIVEFMKHHARKTADVTAKAPVLDDDQWSLFAVLADDKALCGSDFPSAASSLPESIRKYKGPVVVDARDDLPWTLRRPIAFSYRGFWWTFWLKEIDELPDPDETTEEEWRRKPCYDTLILFPEYRSQ